MSNAPDNPAAVSMGPASPGPETNPVWFRRPDRGGPGQIQSPVPGGLPRERTALQKTVPSQQKLPVPPRHPGREALPVSVRTGSTRGGGNSGALAAFQFQPTRTSRSANPLYSPHSGRPAHARHRPPTSHSSSGAGRGRPSIPARRLTADVRVHGCPIRQLDYGPIPPAGRPGFPAGDFVSSASTLECVWIATKFRSERPGNHPGSNCYAMNVPLSSFSTTNRGKGATADAAVVQMSLRGSHSPDSGANAIRNPPNRTPVSGSAPFPAPSRDGLRPAGASPKLQGGLSADSRRGLRAMHPRAATFRTRSGFDSGFSACRSFF